MPDDRSQPTALECLATELVEYGYLIVAVDEATHSVLADIGGTRRRIFVENVQE